MPLRGPRGRRSGDWRSGHDAAAASHGWQGPAPREAAWGLAHSASAPWDQQQPIALVQGAARAALRGFARGLPNRCWPLAARSRIPTCDLQAKGFTSPPLAPKAAGCPRTGHLVMPSHVGAPRTRCSFPAAPSGAGCAGPRSQLFLLPLPEAGNGPAPAGSSAAAVGRAGLAPGSWGAAGLRVPACCSRSMRGPPGVGVLLLSWHGMPIPAGPRCWRRTPSWVPPSARPRFCPSAPPAVRGSR